VERGEIIDWKAITRIWEFIFVQELGIESTDDLSVVMTCSPTCPREVREKMADIVFRYFKVSSLCLVNQATMSLFSAGRTTGVVLEVGDGVSHAVPIFEGFALAHAVKRVNLAGADVTAYLGKLVKERGVGELRKEVLQDMKEKACLYSTKTAVSVVFLCVRVVFTVIEFATRRNPRMQTAKLQLMNCRMAVSSHWTANAKLNRRKCCSTPL